ncbi:MAG: glycoside hydrolase family 16 protein [Bacteroidaceae bacterium]|nr:glycoside hydrolase family 16 protein [Bacteroidaceae bacterium]
MKHTIYNILLGAALALPATAQVATVTFDTDDYQSVGVYDAWENSPFRTGALQGNAAVIDNPLTDVEDILGEAPNPTAKVLAVQRSRYGSNQFGARIDLKTPFALSPTTQYVHVLINRPVSGRVMLMGLGKHREEAWAGQSAETEQFWSLSTNEVTPGKWADAVFAIKGVSGVDIYSLVVVPECESPHASTQDFIAYIDQIEVNSNSQPSVSYEEYPVNFSKTDAKATRTDRGILSVALRSIKTLTITSAPTTNDPLYRDRMDATFPVTPGQRVTPVFSYKGTWMNGYAYVDYGNDGKFSFDINDNGTPAEGSDLVSYSAYNQRNSVGTSLGSNNTLNMPAFTVPETTPYGFYRMRYKVDWNEIDPAGASTLQENGGGIVDVRLNVHADNVSVVEDNRNGEILSGDGSSLVSTTPFAQALTIKLNPENGFAYNGVRIRHGYNLTGDSLVHGTPQYVDVIVYRNQFDENDCYTIPAELVDGDLLLEGLFVEKGTEMEFNYPINFDLTTTLTRTDRHLDGVTMGGTTASIPNDKLLYHEDMAKTFFGKSGESLSATFSYTGTYMNGFVYIDLDRDGQFSYDLNTNGTPAEGSELMAYSYISGKNSLGNSAAGSALNPPAFTLPDLEDGFYRLRFKVDWSSADPGGNTSSNNLITNNGGGIADYRFRVYAADDVNLLTEATHGTLLAADGSALPATVPFNTALSLQAVPTEGFLLESIAVTHGDLTGPQMFHSVPQRATTVYTADDIFDGVLSIPADIIDGDLQVTATFVRDENYVTPTPTLVAEAAEGGTVLYFDNSQLKEPVAVTGEGDVTVLLHNNTGYLISGLHVSSPNGELDVTAADLSLNRFDIPAELFADNANVVVTPSFTALPEGEKRSSQRWRLAFNDEFDSENGEYAKPNTTKWGTPVRRNAAWNRFIADNDSTSFVRDGYYHARCFANPDTSEDDATMLSGAISSMNLYSFQYGRAEARIKTTKHTGNFPAFWMMPQDNSAGWPNAGEIDIWEQINVQDKAHHTVHSNWTYNLKNTGDPKSTSSEDVNMDGWHVYAIEWDAEQLRWYVDNAQVFSYNKKSADADALEKGQWPFDAPFYLILNQSVGNGSWAAAPDESFTYETLFDYVRVYQIQKSGSDGTDYRTNPSKSQAVTHATRRLLAVGLDDQTVSVPNPGVIYNYVDQPAIVVEAGQTVQPVVDFSTSWMHSYVYIDLDGDKQFTALEPAAGVQPEGTELMAYSYYDEGAADGVGYNSIGTRFTTTNQTALPAFTIPANLAPGTYRMRFKVDWNCIDAAGSTVPGNDIVRNGGAFCDVNLLVEESTGLGRLTGAPLQGADGWYDLQGRRVASPVKGGVYIKDGRKVLVK